MSNVSERTPLLGSASSPRPPADSFIVHDPLAPYSERLIGRILSGTNGQITFDSPDPIAQLIILVYARHLLLSNKGHPTNISGDDSISEDVRSERARIRSLKKVDSEIENRLDGVGDVDNGLLTDMLWVRYKIKDDTYLSGESASISVRCIVDIVWGVTES